MAVLALASCGGDDADGPADTTTEAPAATDDGGTATTAGATTTVAAAGSTPASTNPSTTAGESEDGCTDARRGGSVTMAMPIFLTTFDPTAAPSVGSNQSTEQTAIYDTLVRGNPTTLEYEPWLAESLEANADSTEWTVHLRPDVVFPDGTPLDAEAVRASIERHRAPESRSSARRPLTLVDTIDAVDPLTVRFTLNTPWANFPSMLTGPAGMVTNPRVVADRGTEFGTDPTDAGVGPYTLERLAPGEEVVLAAKSDYWAGPVCIERLRFVPGSDAQAALDSVELGEYQMAYLLQAPQVVAQAKADGVAGSGALLHAGNALLMNVALPNTTPATADVRVRQAIAAAIDPAGIDERAFAGTGHPTSAIIHPDSALSPGVPGPAYDPAAATALVEQAKADGWDGAVRYVGPDYPSAQNAAIAIQAMLAAVGIDMSMDIVPSNQHIAQVLEGKYDITWWSLQNNEANLWDGFSQLRSDIPSNYGKYADPRWDAALLDLLAADDADAQVAVLATMQEIWNETVPMAVWASTEYYVATADDVHGLFHDRNSIVHFDGAYVDG